MEKKVCGHEIEHKERVEKVKADMLSELEVAKMAEIFAVLSQPSRLKLVLALLKGDMCVYHLTELCGGTVSGVSHQLRILRDKNVVKTRRLGKNVEYSIADEHVREIVEKGRAHLICDNRGKE